MFWQERTRPQGTTLTLWDQVLAKRRQLSVGGSLRAGFPADITGRDRCPGPNWPSGSTGHPHRRGRFCKLLHRQMAAPIRWQRQRLGRGSLPPQGLRPASSGALQDRAFSLFPGHPSSLTDLMLDELKSPGERARVNSYRTLWLGTTTLLIIRWMGPLMVPQW